MAILTKFLQLLKPERNDYVDVEKHLSENYDKIDTKLEELSNSNDEKLNKGNVSSEYDTAKKIEDKIKEAKKAGDTAKTEADKKLNKGNLISTIQSGEDIFKALQNNTGIKFDENLLYLNDAGTKKKGLCYLDKLTDGIFECIQETTTTVNNATYFKNFSNKENSDRLSNLEEKCYLSISLNKTKKTENINLLKNNDTNKKIQIVKEGVYVITVYSLLEINTEIELKINNTKIAEAPNSDAKFGTSIVYTTHLKSNDIVEFTTTHSFNIPDCGVSIFKL
jgi:hypothetical protein|nr:MAG TPA_asm: hypothetical protein [Caudoviricetes sp.]